VETIIQQIRQLVENSRLDAALDLLLEHASSNAGLKDEASILKNTLSRVEREKRIGAMDFREYSRETVKISSAILDLIRQLPTQAVPTPAPAPPAEPVSTVPPPTPVRPYKVFVSYAREDEDYVKKLRAHLRSLELDGMITLWTDDQILTGDAWAEEIQKQMDQTDIMLLLMSPDFVNSDFIQRVELKQALERKVAGKNLVVPVNLRRVHLPEFLSRLQYTPRQAPVAGSPDQDEAWYTVAQDIKKLIKGKFEPTTNS
jgi:nucleotide-binding universal stress UspA family protein